MLQNQTIINLSNKNNYFKLLENSLNHCEDKSQDLIAVKKSLLKDLSKNSYALAESKIIKLFNTNQEKASTNTTPNLQNKSIFLGEQIGSSPRNSNYMTLTDQSLIGNTSNMNIGVSPIQTISSNINKSSSNIENIHRISNPQLYKSNPKLPFIILSISATLSSKQFVNLIDFNFSKVKCKQICILKDTKDELSLVYQTYSKNCFYNCIQKIKKIPPVQLLIYISFKAIIDSEKYTRRIAIRSIKGEEKKIQKKIVKFIKQISPFFTSFKVIKQSKNFDTCNLEEYIISHIKNHKTKLFSEKNILYKSDYDISFKEKSMNESSLIELSNSEAMKYLDIYRILSKENYGLGKAVGEFINEFKQNYSNTTSLGKDFSTKKLMDRIIKEIEECQGTFRTSFNCSDDNNNQKIYIRQAVEQFIFNKIYFLLIGIYKEKYKTENENYIKKKKEINEKMSINDIFNHLDVKKKFRGDDIVPYKVSIDLINIIEYEQSPKKKFENLSQANLEIRNAILGYSQGKAELDSMDDELPIIIYLATQVNIDNFPAELYLIDDYLKCIIKDDLIQNKMLINLQSAVTYISHSWDDDNNK